MSQDYFGGGGESSKRAVASPPPLSPRRSSGFARPNYLTVGANGPSENAERLQALLDNDSGYGPSIADSASSASIFGELRDEQSASDVNGPISCRFSRIQTNSKADQNCTADHERRAVASHVYQLHYNHNRTALGRAITRTLETLRKLKDVNQQWPAHYPSAQPHARPIPPHLQSRPAIRHTESSQDPHHDQPHGRPAPPARASTSLEPQSSASPSSSKHESQKSISEPRLVTDQLARDFSVLKIDLKMDGLPQTEIIHSLRRDSKALAQLLDGQINKTARHLTLLRERIEDTSSKVLVTGDLNAGKSTFCNALLRRKILPEDEQPCTSIFCEVLDVRENAGVEEVHAIPVARSYNRNDESTYTVFPLTKLESIVTDSEHYSQCKIYIKDERSVDESLLNNGVLDIALIDAPGLNNDSIKTTAVFARQEEIDVVVFVVSAANHFTLSAKDFIFDAAREKAFMFMVVNGFDTIKNKERCEQQILKQVQSLSPQTFKESSELVHFVSSNAVPVAPLGGNSSSGGRGASSGTVSGNPDGNGDDGDDDGEEPLGKHGEPGSPPGKDKGKGKDKERVRDFEELEASLRRFVLEKRARSKLAPARTYLVNVLLDVGSLASVNRDVADSETARVTEELANLTPKLDESKQARNSASDKLDQETEDSATHIYSYTRETINATISDVSSRDLGVEYPGVLDAYSYAENIVAAMLQEVSTTVGNCEEYARQKTTESVNTIKSLGILHLGDSYIDLHFQSDRMLRRRKDALARQIEVDIDFWDFFDVAGLWDRQEKLAGSGMALAVAGTLGSRLFGGMGWVDGAVGAARLLGSRTLSRLFVPLLMLSVALGVSYAVASIPESLPRRLSAKVATQLAAIDFTHSNALRISSEVRRTLKLPADNLRVGLQRSYEQLQGKREELSKIRSESEVARKYFGNLVRESGEIRTAVERVDLEPTLAAFAAASEM